jgi:multisubunit Na+/H+ antiporter MnhG subunit
MTTINLVFTLAGATALILGLVTLLRPSLIRRLIGAKDSEPAKYGLLIAGMMIAAFGLLLAGFAIGFTTAKPLDMNLGASR